MSKRSFDIPYSKRLLMGGGAALGSMAMLLAGCESVGAVSTTPGVSQTADKPTVSPTEAPTTKEWLPAKGDYLSADKVAELGGQYDKLVEAFTLHGEDFSSFEEFVEMVNYLDESYLRSGTSAAEIEKFKGTPAQLDEFAAETYAAPYAEATSLHNTVDTVLDNHHQLIASNYILTRYTGTGVGYEFSQDVVGIKSTKGKITDKTFTVTYIVQQRDNFEETALTQVGTKEDRAFQDKLEVTVTAHRMDDGSVKTETHWGDAPA
ncbi:MAG: hypothetical protein ABIP74_02470 [Candidatus Saccharimonas sp.]